MAATNQRASLLDWPQQKEITALAKRRSDLCDRLEQLRQNSHKFIVLEAQLRILTAQQLKLENDLSEGGLRWKMLVHT